MHAFKCLFVFAALAVVALVVAQPAHAATVTVTNTLDSGPGSLRQVIAGATAGDTVVFDHAVFSTTQTINLSTGEIMIAQSLTIDGASGGAIPTIDANSASRIFHIMAGANVTLNLLSIRNGHCIGVGCNGGAIYNSGASTITIVYFDNNNAPDGYGGAIYNDFASTLSVSNSMFQNSMMPNGYGAGIYNAFAGTVKVDSSTFAYNRVTSGHGGGIYNASGGIVTVTNSIFAYNSALSGYGAGIENTYGGDLKLFNNTFSLNAAAYGGGIYNRGTTTLRNTIIANNPSGADCVNDNGNLTDGSFNLDSDGSCGLNSVNQSLPGIDPLLGPLGYYGGYILTLPLLPGSPSIDAGTCSGAPTTDGRGIARPQVAGCDIGAFESRGFTFGNQSGTPQSTPIRAAFPSPLGLSVNSAYGEPVDSGQVVFEGVATVIGPSVEPAVYTATIAGGHVAQLVTANGVAGGPYDVFASTRGVAGTLVYTLTNLCPPVASVDNLSDSSVGSLRQATIDVCMDGTVVFNPGMFNLPRTITLASGPILLAKSMTIDGTAGGVAVPTVSGNYSSSVFTVNASASVTLNRLNIINGTCASLSCNGGGIANNGTLRIINSTLSGNSAPGNLGGGIYNNGTLTITNSTFSANSTAGGYGGGLYNDYGAILSLTGSTLDGNGAANGYGGGIYNAFGGTLEVINSTLANNSAASGYGGGIYNWGTLGITNSTFSGNSAASISGGGIYNAGASAFRNTLIANSPAGGNCSGAQSVTDGGYNLSSDGTCDFGAANHSLTYTAALLGSLAGYGGGTMVFALLPGSPAIDNGTCNGAPVIDQRGIARPQPAGASCDIGAYESQGFAFASQSGTPQTAGINTTFGQPLSLSIISAHAEPVDGGQVIFSAPEVGPSIQPPVYTATIAGGAVAQTVGANGTTGGPYIVRASARGVPSFAFYLLTNQCRALITVDNTADNGAGSLRQAIAEVCVGGTVVFSPTVFNVPLTITLASDQMVIAKSLTIDGAAGGVAAPTIDGHNTYRVFRVNAGASVVLNHLRITNGYCALAGCNGGGILNSGVLTVTGSTFVGSSTPNGFGGAVYDDYGSALSMAGSTFVSNSAAFGGAVANNGLLNVTNSTLFGNAALSGYGGGIYNAFTSTVNSLNSTFAANTAPFGFGGGIANLGSATLRNTIVANSPSGGNCFVATSPITDGGYNLDSGSSCGFSAHAVNNSNPMLDALGNYGGSTETMQLLARSPAIDTGNDATCPSTDQRGVHRPMRAHCDIGAYEAPWQLNMPVVRH